MTTMPQEPAKVFTAKLYEANCRLTKEHEMGKIDDVELEVRLAHEIYPALLKDGTYQQLSKRRTPNAMSKILITFTKDDLKTFLLALLELGNNSGSGLEEVSTEELVAYLIKYIAFYLTLDYMAEVLKNKS